MMDAYNIAVCFGPTLLPVPDNFDPVTCQANVNEVIKVNTNKFISAAHASDCCFVGLFTK